ncbi:hypothetical protein C8R46DRAFT_50998, partial [Mycena filopes]
MASRLENGVLREPSWLRQYKLGRRSLPSPPEPAVTRLGVWRLESLRTSESEGSNYRFRRSDSSSLCWHTLLPFKMELCKRHESSFDPAWTLAPPRESTDARMCNGCASVFLSLLPLTLPQTQASTPRPAVRLSSSRETTLQLAQILVQPAYSHSPMFTRRNGSVHSGCVSALFVVPTSVDRSRPRSSRGRALTILPCSFYDPSSNNR